MKFTTALTAALSIVALQATALPSKRSSTITDFEVLNFALTLEHLENAFYTQGLNKYSQSDFIKAGLPPWARGRFVEIAKNEAAHAAIIESVLGSQAVQPCEYDFGDTDVKAFVDFSALAETVGSSAYSGAAGLLTNKEYVTGAATILATEARQAAWVNSAILKGAPWSSPFEAPLSLNQVFTIASGVITGCPSGNAALLPSTLKAFPALSFPANATPGAKVQFDITNPTPATTGPFFAAFISGLNTTFVPLDGDSNEVVIPSELFGVVFALITTNGTQVDDSTTVAGPTFLNFVYDSQGKIET